jgi:hypothetical protein
VAGWGNKCRGIIFQEGKAAHGKALRLKNCGMLEDLQESQ